MMGKYVLDNVDQIVLGLKNRSITLIEPTVLEVRDVSNPRLVI